MFIDEARIRVQGGRGGDGVISFISNAHNWRGGPDGGTGGDGGLVLLRASASLSTLYGYRNEPTFRGGDGKDGARNTRAGARGEERIVLVPPGTTVRDDATGEVLADLASPGEEVTVAAAGEGGRGNRSFTTSTRRAPRICERGLRGEARTLRLELRLLADVGIIGCPNVGKSSLISRISAAKAKVADYPFTTLVPNLGVVDVDGTHQFVAVDIPGLIEGAHAGKGLGDRFLRHVERTRVLVHLVDLAGLEGRDPLEEYRQTSVELAAFSRELSARPQVVAGNKVDLLDEKDVQAAVERFAQAGVTLWPISAATGAGVRDLVLAAHRLLESAPGTARADHAPRRRVYTLRSDEGFTVERDGCGFAVRGGEAERLAKKLVLDSRDARDYLRERLEKLGVLRELHRQGFAGEGPVRIGDVPVELAR